MADDNGDKTEQPTDRRRQEVREEGNVARSTDLTAAALLLASALALQWGGSSLVDVFGQLLRGSLSEPAWTQIDAGLLAGRLEQITRAVAPSLLLIWAILIGGVLASNFAQVGFFVSTEVLTPKWERLNPISGLQRLWSLSSLVRVGISLLKLILLLSVAGWFVWNTIGRYVGLMETELAPAAAALGSTLVTLAYQLAGVLLVLAVLDYGFQYWKFEQDIKMTKQELREEYRNMEGDPLIRQRRKEAHRKLTDARQIQQTKTADAIITNPTHISVAIKYDADQMDAPVVVAKGSGMLAMRIREIAREHGIPIIERKPLARSLFKLVKVGQAIPVELYEAVAEILAYVYKLKGKAKRAA